MTTPDRVVNPNSTIYNIRAVCLLIQVPRGFQIMPNVFTNHISIPKNICPYQALYSHPKKSLKRDP